YIRIDQFTNRTGDEMKQALRDAQNKGFKGMILDLRNNPGGLVSSCVSVASQFLKSDNTVFIEQMRGGDEKSFKASSGGLAPDIPYAAADNEDPLGYFNAVMYRAVDYLRNGG